MKLVKSNEGVEYKAPGHIDCFVMNKLVFGKDAKKMNIGISHFLPGGGAEMSSAPVERAYYVMSGSIKVNGKNKEEYTVNAGDLIYIADGEDREFKVLGNNPSTIMVFAAKLD